MIVNTSFLLGSKYAGRVITSLGTSIASIGLPAVTFPNNGTVTTSSLLVSNSFGTWSSSKWLLVLPLFKYPFSISFFTWTWAVAGELKLKLADISLIDGGYFFCAEYFFMYSNISFCLFVPGSAIWKLDRPYRRVIIASYCRTGLLFGSMDMRTGE